MSTEESPGPAPISNFKSQLHLVTDTFLKLSPDQQSEAVRLIQGLHSSLLNQVCPEDVDCIGASSIDPNELLGAEGPVVENCQFSRVPIASKDFELSEQFIATCEDLERIQDYLQPNLNCDNSVPHFSLETNSVLEPFSAAENESERTDRACEGGNLQSNSLPSVNGLPHTNSLETQCLVEGNAAFHQNTAINGNDSSLKESFEILNHVFSQPLEVTANANSCSTENDLHNINNEVSGGVDEVPDVVRPLGIDGESQKVIEKALECDSSARTNGVTLRRRIRNLANKGTTSSKDMCLRRKKLKSLKALHGQLERKSCEPNRKPKKTNCASHTCNLCHLTFSQQQHLRKHLLGHQRNDCKFCNAQFTKRKGLCQHMKQVHKILEAEKLYKCSFCGRGFFKRPSLYAHLKEHAEGKTVCVKCGEMCETEEAHAEHLKRHADGAKFRCTRCDESFHRRQQFEQHVTGHEKHVCGLCSTNFSTKKLLTKHWQAVHGIPVKEEKKHECGICKKRFQRPMLLQVHQRIHNDERPTQCSQCLKSFRTAKALSKHMQTFSHLKHASDGKDSPNVELEKPYLCAQCGAKFYRRQSLARHTQQLHSDTKPFECPYCSYKCRCKTNLKRHIELHTDSRRFVCELCGSSFHALATLKEHHAYVHSDLRGFVCDQCGKGFKGKSGLKRHMRIHSDARPYECRCGQSYKRMSHLKRHMVSAHHMQFQTKRVKRLGEEESSEDDPSPIEESLQENPAPTECSFTVFHLTASEDNEASEKVTFSNLNSSEYILVKGVDKNMVGESLVSFLTPESQSCELGSEMPISLEIPSLQFHLQHPSSLVHNDATVAEEKMNAFPVAQSEDLNIAFEKLDSSLHGENLKVQDGSNENTWNQSIDLGKLDTLKDLQLPQIQYTLSVPMPLLNPPLPAVQAFSIFGSSDHVQTTDLSVPLDAEGVEHFLSV